MRGRIGALRSRDFMVQHAPHFIYITKLVKIWQVPMSLRPKRPKKAFSDLWWPLKIVGDFQVGKEMLHSKYDSDSTIYPLARVCQLYYVVLKNVVKMKSTIRIVSTLKFVLFILLEKKTQKKNEGWKECVLYFYYFCCTTIK